ncbi:putative ribonuclease H-like domain-containing protein [Tanacetum coccineum]
MGVTLSGSQGLSSPQANGYVVKAYKIRCWLPGYPKLDGFHLPCSWNEKWLVQEGTALDANFLVADSKFMKIAFGDGFKMLLINPLVCSTKDLSRNLKYVVSTGRVKVPAGSVVPTGKDSSIVSTGGTKVIPAGNTILVLEVLCLLRVGIRRDYSNARTPQQNGVAERKNRTLIEAARTMLAELQCYLTKFGQEALVFWPDINLMGKADKGFIVGYAAHSKAYRGLDHAWYFDLDYLTDSLGYTRFKTNQPTVEQHLSQADIATSRNGVPAGKVVSAAGVTDGSTDLSTPIFTPVHTAATSLPPGHSLGSSEHSTRYPSPSELANSVLKIQKIDIHHILTLAFFLILFIMMKIFGGTWSPLSTKYRGKEACPSSNGKLLIGTKWILKNKLDGQCAFLEWENKEECMVTQPRDLKILIFPKLFTRVLKSLNGLHQAPKVLVMPRLSTLSVNQHNYKKRSMICSLMYLTALKGPDIQFGSSAILDPCYTFEFQLECSQEDL